MLGIPNICSHQLTWCSIVSLFGQKIEVAVDLKKPNSVHFWKNLLLKGLLLLWLTNIYHERFWLSIDCNGTIILDFSLKSLQLLPPSTNEAQLERISDDCVNTEQVCCYCNIISKSNQTIWNKRDLKARLEDFQIDHYYLRLQPGSIENNIVILQMMVFLLDMLWIFSIINKIKKCEFVFET